MVGQLRSLPETHFHDSFLAEFDEQKTFDQIEDLAGMDDRPDSNAPVISVTSTLGNIARGGSNRALELRTDKSGPSRLRTRANGVTPSRDHQTP
ncbi:hypothetical protein CTA1_8287 [Colletotrichum tanaceti]|uniref:Uncharacterized protein n=1 Tax=Colletotrichum tanaceti TaxID=1306861 RepID=A0A4U6X5U7_9PEZI|nr:hypothetical protein CTA1_8287 [Colletotrichum tanaceti]